MAKDPDRRGRRTGALDPADAALFRAAMREVEPITDAGRDVETTPAVPAKTPNAARPRAGAGPPPVLRAGAPADLDGRTATRLRRGHIRPEARLDLHHMTQEQAHHALVEFVSRSHGAGRRCVLVITGRGKLGVGVLREQLPHWLNTAPIRGCILGFAQAQPKDGGAGAFYVLLRRNSSRSDRSNPPGPR